VTDFSLKLDHYPRISAVAPTQPSRLDAAGVQIGTKTTIVPAGAGLVAPGGIAIGPDGSIYVTNLSVSPGDGTVVKIVP
jgi:glucose/arabinose dehydrogenase